VWKSPDALFVRTVPKVRKAVRWNTPVYGIEGQGWFITFHCVTKYVKVCFFQGSFLDPVSPVSSKHKDVRHVHIFESEQLNMKQRATWMRLASKLPGETCCSEFERAASSRIGANKLKWFSFHRVQIQKKNAPSEILGAFRSISNRSSIGCSVMEACPNCRVVLHCFQYLTGNFQKD